MKKTIVIGLVALGLVGCDRERTAVVLQPPLEGKAPPDKVWNITLQNDYNPSADIHLIEIDGCEYLANRVHGGIALAHKGNCKYCLAKNR